jgi:hypothetical protein
MTSVLTSTRLTPPIWARALLAGAAAAAINLVVFAVASAAGASMVITAPQQMTIPWVAVIFASVAPLAIAGVVTWALARRWPRIRVPFAWAGLVVAALSSLAVLSAGDVTTAIALAAMHVITGVAWFASLTLKTRGEKGGENR